MVPAFRPSDQSFFMAVLVLPVPCVPGPRKAVKRSALAETAVEASASVTAFVPAPRVICCMIKRGSLTILSQRSYPPLSSRLTLGAGIGKHQMVVAPILGHTLAAARPNPQRCAAPWGQRRNQQSQHWCRPARSSKSQNRRILQPPRTVPLSGTYGASKSQLTKEN